MLKIVFCMILAIALNTTPSCGAPLDELHDKTDQEVITDDYPVLWYDQDDDTDVGIITQKQEPPTALKIMMRRIGIAILLKYIGLRIWLEDYYCSLKTTMRKFVGYGSAN